VPTSYRFAADSLDGDEIVGYAALDVFPTAVCHGSPPYDERGAVGALGGRRSGRRSPPRRLRASSASTESEEQIVPMRRLNESLGYRAEPGLIVYKGPLT
jgi:hypothetical protein